MSEIKTVTHDGKVYQLGKHYLFSDDGSNWTISSLKSISYASDFPFRSGFSWRLIKEFESSDVGTITPAPIELVDGAAYMFDFQGRKVDRIGIYHKEVNHFIFPIGHTHVTNCTNIRPMTVESK
jgi:hypothetical protein